MFLKARVSIFSFPHTKKRQECQTGANQNVHIKVCRIIISEGVSAHWFQPAGSAEVEDLGSVVVKVHYTYTVALSVPLYAPYRDVKGLIAQKLGQPASQLRLR